MTSKLTREENVQAVFDLKAGYTLGLADVEILKRVARMALAAIDSEPVAWIAIYHGEVYDEAIGITRSVVEAQADHFGWESALTEIIPLYSHAQQPVVPDESYQQLSELYHAQEKRLFKIAQRIKGPAFDKYSHSPSQAIDVLEGAIFGEGEACRAAMLQAGNSPVIPDGYVMVPKEPTETMINAWLSEVANWRGHVAGYKAMLAVAPQEVK